MMDLVKMEDFIRFTNNSAGFEKMLKGSQGLCKILTAESSANFPKFLATTQPIRKGFGTEQDQLSLGRRFVRFLWFIDSAMKAIGTKKGSGDKILKALIIGKWAMTTVYTFSEAITVLHAMGIRKSRWAKPLLHWGMKCYFISIVCSIMASMYQLLPYMLNPDLLDNERQQQQQRHSYSAVASSSSASTSAAAMMEERRRSSATSAMSRPPPPYDTPESRSDHEYPPNGQAGPSSSSSHHHHYPHGLTSRAIDPDMERKKLYVDAAKNAPINKAPVKIEPIILSLFADICDIWGPASSVGFAKVSPETLGFAAITNALLSGKVIWDRVNAS